MTISYSGNFFKILLRWKGSIWKAVWAELLVWIICFQALGLLYRFVLDEDWRDRFEKTSLTFDSFTRRVPLDFLLGFYVTSVIRRWWEQFQFVAWPDDVISYICILLPRPDQLKTRRAIARWLNLTAVLAWRDVSKSVRTRFPSMNHIIQAGLMTKDELQIYDALHAKTIQWNLPLFWVRSTVNQELRKEEGRVFGPVYAQFLRELNIYRNCFKTLYCYDWVCIPLVYTQVAALATYGYFIVCLLGRQFLDPKKDIDGSAIDYYVPGFTMLEFTFYVGWFKVGQYLMRPFEEDDDDIELNYMLDRHIQTSFGIVDETAIFPTRDLILYMPSFKLMWYATACFFISVDNF